VAAGPTRMARGGPMARAVGGGGAAGADCAAPARAGASAWNIISRLPRWIVWPGWSTACLTRVRLTNVPLVEPRSMMTNWPPSTTTWQWVPETDGSSSATSLSGPRPKEFFPALSWISQAAGEPGWTTSRAIDEIELCAVNLTASSLFPGRPSRRIFRELPPNGAAPSLRAEREQSRLAARTNAEDAQKIRKSGSIGGLCEPGRLAARMSLRQFWSPRPFCSRYLTPLCRPLVLRPILLVRILRRSIPPALVALCSGFKMA
jgi:hypothetical protein